MKTPADAPAAATRGRTPAAGQPPHTGALPGVSRAGLDPWVASAARPGARDVGLQQLVQQHPLLQTRPSLWALRRSTRRLPQAVFVGIGLASGQAISRALPLDTLGLLLAAEAVREQTGAEQLVVLLADQHAIECGASHSQVKERTDAYAHQLTRVASRCGLDHLRLLRASRLHAQAGYRGLLRRICAQAPEGTSPYVTREVADIAHLDDTLGGILKVGWALQPNADGAMRDERMFDERFRTWVGRDVTFLYAKPGRALSDRQPKAAPYLEQRPERRICLAPGEDVHGKFERARGHVSLSTLRGVRNHLSAIARSYGKRVRPLQGPLDVRLQLIIDELTAPRGRSGRSSNPPPAFVEP